LRKWEKEGDKGTRLHPEEKGKAKITLVLKETARSKATRAINGRNLGRTLISLRSKQGRYPSNGEEDGNEEISRAPPEKCPQLTSGIRQPNETVAKGDVMSTIVSSAGYRRTGEESIKRGRKEGKLRGLGSESGRISQYGVGGEKGDLGGKEMSKEGRNWCRNRKLGEEGIKTVKVVGPRNTNPGGGNSNKDKPREGVRISTKMPHLLKKGGCCRITASSTRTWP